MAYVGIRENAGARGPFRPEPFVLKVRIPTDPNRHGRMHGKHGCRAPLSSFVFKWWFVLLLDFSCN